MMSEPAFLLVRVTVTNTAGSGLVWQQTPLILHDMTAAAVAISLSLALKTRCTRRSGHVEQFDNVCSHYTKRSAG